MLLGKLGREADPWTQSFQGARVKRGPGGQRAQRTILQYFDPGIFGDDAGAQVTQGHAALIDQAKTKADIAIAAHDDQPVVEVVLDSKMFNPYAGGRGLDLARNWRS